MYGRLLPFLAQRNLFSRFRSWIHPLFLVSRGFSKASHRSVRSLPELARNITTSPGLPSISPLPMRILHFSLPYSIVVVFGKTVSAILFTRTRKRWDRSFDLRPSVSRSALAATNPIRRYHSSARPCNGQNIPIRLLALYRICNLVCAGASILL